MSFDDDFARALRDTERILGPLRDFDRLYGHGLQKLLADQISRQEQLFQSALPQLSNLYLCAIDSVLPAIDRLREFEVQSPTVKALLGTQESFSQLLARHADLERISRASVALGPQWQDSIDALQRLETTVGAAELTLQSHYASVAEVSLLAQECLSGIPWKALGRATRLDVGEFSVIDDGFRGLVDSYGRLMRSFEERDHFMASFPPIASMGPPIEILTVGRVLESLSRVPMEDEESEAKWDLEANLVDEIEASVDELLIALDSELNRVWHGAKEALRSTNPDRGRHVVVSLRELVTHVLHSLAPNDQVGEWSRDPSDFHNGRPTRSARMRFICRGINHGPLAAFLDVDVAAATEFIALFQRGTHELDAGFSEEQLRALVTRTDSLLRFLLLVSKGAR